MRKIPNLKIKDFNFKKQMNFNSKCESCGHVEAAYSHHLNAPLVKALRQLVDFYEKNQRFANLQKDLYLSKNQYNNFQKLQYFGLVDRTALGWFPTRKGTGFIYGEEKVFDKVATFKKDTLSPESDFWSDKKRKPFLISVGNINLDSWKKREDYQNEKSNQLHIF